jgi:DNA-binding transcriptional LysR family regulator
MLDDFLGTRRGLHAVAYANKQRIIKQGSRPHVLVSHTANVSGFADEWLAEIGRKRQVVLSVPQHSALPALLAGTDLIASLPDYTAEAMAVSGQLFCEPFPFETPTLDLSMVWLSHVDTDPAERWVRSLSNARRTATNPRSFRPVPTRKLSTLSARLLISNSAPN